MVRAGESERFGEHREWMIVVMFIIRPFVDVSCFVSLIFYCRVEMQKWSGISSFIIKVLFDVPLFTNALDSIRLPLLVSSTLSCWKRLDPCVSS